MKNYQIVLLVLILGGIVYLTSTQSNLSSYESIETAKKTPNKFVHIIAKLDTQEPVVYNPIQDPNYFEFYITDSLGGKAKVIYHNPKPTDIEKADRIVLKGKFNQTGVYECSEILIKCPSKYKDENLKSVFYLDSKYFIYLC